VSKPKFHFILPIFNEEVNVERLVKNLSAIARTTGHEFDIIAVNDGSNDRSLELLEKLKSVYPLTILNHPVNQGPGKAFQTGFQYIVSHFPETDIGITMDADNTHSEKTIQMMIKAIEEGYELIIASVFAPGGMMIGVPFLRYILTMGCNFLYRIFFPVRGIREYTGFYRGFPVRTLKAGYERYGSSFLTASGFAAMAEMLIKLRQIPLFMREVPMIVRYDRKGGKSKMRIMRTVWEHLRIIGCNLFRRRIV